MNYREQILANLSLRPMTPKELLENMSTDKDRNYSKTIMDLKRKGIICTEPVKDAFKNGRGIMYCLVSDYAEDIVKILISSRWDAQSLQMINS